MSTHDQVPARAAPGPVEPGERVRLLDVLRGFALFGILVVNMELLKSALDGASLPPRFDGAADRVTSWLISFAFESKFYVLFSFLFGYGLSVQMARAAAQGVPLVPRYLRRLGGLLLLGVAHALLLYTGDILIAYSLLGLLLLGARNNPSRTLLWWAGALVVGWALVLGLSAVAAAAEGPPPAERAAEIADAREGVAAAEAAYRGAPAGVVAQRARELPLVWGSAVAAMLPVVLAMFLLGLWAGRRALLSRVAEHEVLLRRARRVGLAIGLPGAAIYATAVRQIESPALAIAGLAVGVVSAPALSAVYATSIALASRRSGWGRALGVLAPVGRMALSNYLLQSLACALIFTGYGLALFGRVGPLASVGLSVAIFACQVVLSAVWLRSFRFGPAEWALRTLTYLRVQPLRAARRAAASPPPERPQPREPAA